MVAMEDVVNEFRAVLSGPVASAMANARRATQQLDEVMAELAATIRGTSNPTASDALAMFQRARSPIFEAMAALVSGEAAVNDYLVVIGAAAGTTSRPSFSSAAPEPTTAPRPINPSALSKRKQDSQGKPAARRGFKATSLSIAIGTATASATDEMLGILWSDAPLAVKLAAFSVSQVVSSAVSVWWSELRGKSGGDGEK